MKYARIIGLVMAAAVILFTATAEGVETRPEAFDEQMAKAYVEVKCDPCDYNLDYGRTSLPVDKGGVDEGTVKLKCDPCDYNIDYGATEHPVEK